MAPQPDPTLGEPVVWLQRLQLVESLDAPECIRDISFRRGLNIIATEAALPEDTVPVGHDVGKTMLVRIIRYCLGEEAYCDQATRAAIAAKLPDAYALGAFRVAGETWCVARPLGVQPGTRSWCGQTDDLDSMRRPFTPRRHADFVDALNAATGGCYADIGLPHAENRKARWQDLLGWLSRDQECLFRHAADWRVAESQAGPRVLRREDAYLIMRMALGLFPKAEAAATREHDALREGFRQKEIQEERIFAFLERMESGLRRLLSEKKIDTGAFPEGSLLGPAAVAHAEEKIASLSGLLRDLWDQRDIEAAREALDAAIAELAIQEHSINEQEAIYATLKETLTGLREQDDTSLFKKLGGSGFPCPYWPGDKDAAKAAGCPGEDPMAADSDGVDLRRKANIRHVEGDMRRVEEEMRGITHERDGARAEVDRCRGTLKSCITEMSRAQQGVSEEIGRWKEIRQQADTLQRAWQERDRLLEELKGREAALRAARESLGAAREVFARDLETLSLCYRDIVRRVLSQEVEGRIIVDGNGIRPEVTGASSSGTTLKMCAHVLAYDFACMRASLCGVGHLPRFWMHDSPRAADTEDMLYHRMMEVIRDLENECAATGSPPFQHIWTTTSRPPAFLDGEPYVCLRLHARADDGKLLRRSFGAGSAKQNASDGSM